MSSGGFSWQDELLTTAARLLPPLIPLMNAADPHGSVLPRSRRLCASLGRLSEITYLALGGDLRNDDIGRAGAMLGLLTKIDDEVIDSLAFHGGHATSRDELHHRARAFLAPTLASIHEAKPFNSEPRCRLAAELGTRLRSLASTPDRLAHVLSLIDRGWSIQVDAVTTLTSDPALVTLSHVEHVTGRISGLWLMMIAAIGELPEGARRALSPDEESAFLAWGLEIQGADALADLEKDLREGLISTVVSRRLYDLDPAAHARAVSGRATSAYEAIARHGIDAQVGAAPRKNELTSALAELDRVPSLLDWIRVFLLSRYLAHPLRSRESDPKVTAALHRPESEPLTLTPRRETFRTQSSTLLGARPLASASGSHGMHDGAPESSKDATIPRTVEAPSTPAAPVDLAMTFALAEAPCSAR